MWGKCTCHEMRTQYCPIENKRASGKAAWEPKGRGKGRSTSSTTKTKAAAPHTCGQKHYDGSTCASTVRGGVCPCSASMDFGRWRAYLCRRCRIDQSPAWHWGHLNRGRAR